MANPDLRKAGEIQSKGGRYLAYREVKADGSDLTVPDTWHDMPFRSKSDLEFKETLKPRNEESGDTAAYEKDPYESTLAVTSMQGSAAVEMFLKNTVKDKYVQVFMDCGTDSPGYQKERFIAIAQIERSYKESSPGREIEIKIMLLVNDTEITPASLPSWAVGKAADFVVGPKEYHTAAASKIGGAV